MKRTETSLDEKQDYNFAENFGERFRHLRKKNRLRQADIAKALNVTTQAVSLWEQGKNVPDICKFPELARLFDVSTDWLIAGSVDDEEPMFENELSDRLHNEKRMYTYVKTYAHVKKMYQTCSVLAYAKEQHKGQVRKGADHVPYIYHPLQMACHALALELEDDNLISATLLHDVCEDTGVMVNDLPANDATKEAVGLLTKKTCGNEMTEEELELYYSEISKNPIALMVKVLDRCSNVSSMATAFDRDKLTSYINETEKWFYPMIRKGQNDFPQYANALFLLKYHISSVVSAIKHQLV